MHDVDIMAAESSAQNTGSSPVASTSEGDGTDSVSLSIGGTESGQGNQNISQQYPSSETENAKDNSGEIEPPLTGQSDSQEDEHRRQVRRREQNRRAARKYRHKQQRRANDTLQEFYTEENLNRSLTSEIEKLSAEKRQLETLLRDHMSQCLLQQRVALPTYESFARVNQGIGSDPSHAVSVASQGCDIGSENRFYVPDRGNCMAQSVSGNVHTQGYYTMPVSHCNETNQRHNVGQVNMYNMRANETSRNPFSTEAPYVYDPSSWLNYRMRPSIYQGISNPGVNREQAGSHQTFVEGESPIAGSSTGSRHNNRGSHTLGDDTSYPGAQSSDAANANPTVSLEGIDTNFWNIS